jgi:uncharacterized repeat protein (TIGR02543 family)
MKFSRSALLALSVAAAAAILAACAQPRDGSDLVPSEGSFELTIQVEGPGEVYVEELDITCRDDCTVQAGAGVELELTPQPDDGMGFVRWEQGCTGSGTCLARMEADRTVHAVFAEHVLALRIEGDGQATTRIVPPDASCTDDCSMGYGLPVTASLTVILGEGSFIEGWDGACSESGTQRYCQTSVAGLVNVVLTVTRPPTANPDAYPAEEGRVLTVNAANGVLANDSDASGEALTAELASQPSKGEVELRGDGSFTYTPDAGATGNDSFDYRARDASGNLSGAATVTIRISARPLLDVDVTGDGNGSVTSSPSGIACPGDCSQEFAEGATVTLTASAATGSRFTGWGGACSGSATTCVVDLDTDSSVTAEFRSVLLPLSVSVTGSGSGSVTSNPGSIDCPGTCSGQFTQGTTVTLTAHPGSDTFAGWGGDCSGGAVTCTLTMTTGKSVSAAFEPAPPRLFPLSVTIAGTGDGTVTSTPAGIDCSKGPGPSDCTGDFESGSKVVLTATKTGDSTFIGWEGACSDTTPTCEVTMNGSKSVTATFAQPAPTPTTYHLDVDVNGSGSGRVTSDPGVIDCPGTCSDDFADGDTVTLTASVEDATFAGWGGDCAGSGMFTTCTLTMNGHKSASATFNEPTAWTLRINPAPTGGTVTASGITCGAAGSDCTEEIVDGNGVRLEARSEPNHDFVDWTGACRDNPGPVCSLVLTKNETLTANFLARMSELTVTVDGNGTVAGALGQIAGCRESSGDCGGDFPEGTEVELDAIADDGHRLASWANCGATEGTSCTMTLEEDATVTATFVPVMMSLVMAFSGGGGGSVTLDPPGRSCPGDCQEEYPFGQAVALTASAADGNIFAGWGGDCRSESTATCKLMIDAAKSVTVSFEPESPAEDAPIATVGPGRVSN